MNTPSHFLNSQSSVTRRACFLLLALKSVFLSHLSPGSGGKGVKGGSLSSGGGGGGGVMINGEGPIGQGQGYGAHGQGYGAGGGYGGGATFDNKPGLKGVVVIEM